MAYSSAIGALEKLGIATVSAFTVFPCGCSPLFVPHAAVPSIVIPNIAHKAKRFQFIVPPKIYRIY